jgi:hypothetical protein
MIDRKPLWFPGIAFLLVGYFWMMLSTIFLEESAYISEQNAVSFRNGAFYVLLGYVAFLLAGYLATAHLLGRRMLTAKARFSAVRLGQRSITARQVESIAFRVIASVIVLLIVHAMVSQNPLLGGGDVTRFSFWETGAKVPQLQSVSNQVGPLLFAFAVASNSFRRRIALIALTLLYLPLTGAKFTSLFFCLYLAAYPYLHLLRLKHWVSLKNAKRALAFLCLVAALSYFGYRAEGRGDDAMEILQFAIDRVTVLQGHVWWGAVEYVTQAGPTGDASQFFFGEGMDVLMRTLSPAHIYDSYVNDNVRFTGGYPAILHLILGYKAMPLQFLVGSLFGVLVFGFHHVCRMGFLGAFLGAKFFIPLITVLLMGSLSDLLNWTVVASGFLLLFYTVVIAPQATGKGSLRWGLR